MLGPAEPHDFLTFAAAPTALGYARDERIYGESTHSTVLGRIGRFVFHALTISVVVAAVGLALLTAFAIESVTEPYLF
ncbi:MAG: hypothetical protein VCC04_10390 [Myxococcota bacterium]